MSNLNEKLSPQQLHAVLGYSTKENGDVTDFVEKHVVSGGKSIGEKNLTTAGFYLRLSTVKTDKSSRSQRDKRRRRISSKDKRRFGLRDAQRDQLKYSQVLPLHHVWLQYMESVLDLNRNQDQRMDINLLCSKADYHGCRLVVVRSKNPSLVGTVGIIIRETKNTFVCVTRKDGVKILPKQNSIFSFKVGENLFTIYGNHFRIKSSERTAKKFKNKPTVEL